MSYPWGPGEGLSSELSSATAQGSWGSEFLHPKGSGNASVVLLHPLVYETTQEFNAKQSQVQLLWLYE